MAIRVFRYDDGLVSVDTKILNIVLVLISMVEISFGWYWQYNVMYQSKYRLYQPVPTNIN